LEGAAQIQAALPARHVRKASVPRHGILILVRQPERAIEIVVPQPSLQQALCVKQFQIGQVTERGEAK
jgi:hypothetical protein